MNSNLFRCTRRGVLGSLLIGTASMMLTEKSEATPFALQRGKGKLPRTSPESVGVDAAGILAFVEAVNKKVGGLHSFMLLRNGKVAAEGWWTPYAPELPHSLYSLSKSFTSTAIGFAVSEKKLTVQSPVTSFFPDDLPAKVSDNLAAMTVKSLLTMSTGHDKDTTGAIRAGAGGSWVKGFLTLPVEHQPGSKFVYNSGATYMLAAILYKATGMNVLEYLKPRLFDPLGIVGATWENCPKGINVGGWGLSIKTEDIAKFGQLYLQEGEWNGKPLISKAWIEEATSKQVSNGNPASGSDWNQGYGYQFWRCRHDHYRGDGAFGQYCIVMPKYNTVLAITSGVGDMGAVMNAAWDTLQSALQPSRALKPEATRELKARLGDLEVPMQEGLPISPKSERLIGRTIRFDANPLGLETFALRFEDSKAVLTMQVSNNQQVIECGHKDWIKGMALAGEPFQGKTATRYVWETPDTFVMKRCYIETPYILTRILRFSGDSVTLSSTLNVNFGPTVLPEVKGRVV